MMIEWKNKAVEAAVTYAKNGFSVIPLHSVDPNTKACSCKNGLSCGAAGKHPIWGDWGNRGLCDEREIRQFWQEGTYNLGAVCGEASDLFVIDVDPRNGGDESFARLLEMAGLKEEELNTLKERTGGGGFHYFFSHPSTKVKKKHSRFTGIEFLSDGAQCVISPSYHASGNYYEIQGTVGVLPSDLRSRIKPLPEQILKVLLRHPTAKTDRSKEASNSAGIINEGGRNDACFKKALALFRNGFDVEVARQALKSFNQQQCKPPLHLDEVEAIISSASKYDTSAKESDNLNDLIHFYETNYPWNAPTPLKEREHSDVPFDLSHTPKVIRDYAVAVSEQFQMAPSAAIQIALAGLSGIIGRRYQIQPKADFTVIPNLSCLIIGDPSTLKTPLMKRMLEPLECIERDLQQKNMQYRSTKKSDDEVHQVEISVLKSKLKNTKADKNPDAEATESIKKELAALSAEVEEKPIEHRLRVNDITNERLIELFSMNPYGLVSVWDEIAGLFELFQRKGRESERQIYLSAVSGDMAVAQDRVGRGSIPAQYALLTLIGGIQPDVLKNLAYRSLVVGSSEDGMLQRFPFLALIETNQKYKLVDTPIPKEIRTSYESLFKKLHFGAPSVVDPEFSEFELYETNPAHLESYKFSFDPSAKLRFDDWLILLENRLRMEEPISKAFQAHLGKFRKLYPALALIFFLAENPDAPAMKRLEIPERYCCMADWWCLYLEAQARVLYQRFPYPRIDAQIF